MQFYGWDVAVSGTTVAVSGPLSAQPVAVIDSTTGVVNGDFSSGNTGDGFGRSIDISGDTLIVGAPFDGDLSFNSGAVYIFDITSGALPIKLHSTTSIFGGVFGSSVAIDGDFAVIGEPGNEENGHSSGAVYIYNVSTGGGLVKVLAVDGSADDQFGWAVAISGNLLTVGAPTDEHGNGNYLGSAYVFDILAGGQLAKLVAGDWSDQQAMGFDSQFGFAVGISADAIVVGAPFSDSRRGAAYIFDTTTFVQTAKIAETDPTGSQAEFGFDVAAHGSLSVVGARLHEYLGSKKGSAYIFDTSSASPLVELVSMNPGGIDYFGFAVSMSSNTIIVGAPNDDDHGNNAGAAYIFASTSPYAGTAFCMGLDFGQLCPCGFGGLHYDGCANSSSSGASLLGLGIAQISSDSFRLEVGGAPDSVPGLILRGVSQVNGGLGGPVGDGLLCVGGQTARSHVQVTSAGMTTFTDFQGQPFGQSSYGIGVPTNYQFWYRDAVNTCTGLGFNFSNAWAVTWLP